MNVASGLPLQSIAIGLAVLVQVLIAHQMYSVLKWMPPVCRTTEPWFAWLTLIPLLGLVFLALLMAIEVPNSLKESFQHSSRQPRPEGVPKDYGRVAAAGYLVSLLLCLIPHLGPPAAVAAAIFLCKYFRTLGAAKKHLRAACIDMGYG